MKLQAIRAFKLLDALDLWMQAKNVQVQLHPAVAFDDVYDNCVEAGVLCDSTEFVRITSTAILPKPGRRERRPKKAVACERRDSSLLENVVSKRYEIPV